MAAAAEAAAEAAVAEDIAGEDKTRSVLSVILLRSDIRLRQVILLRSDIRLSPSYALLRRVLSAARSAISLSRSDNITPTQSEYHFCFAKISL